MLLLFLPCVIQSEATNLYERFVALVRGRDQALQGSLNPNLA